MSKSTLDDLIKELRQAFEDEAGRSPGPDRKFHKHDDYLSYGLKVKDLRRVRKEFLSRFLELPFEARLKLAAKLIAENIGELGHTGIVLLTKSIENLSPQYFDYLDQVLDHFRSWGLVDHFCGDVIKPLLLKYPELVLELLEKWSESSNRWKRRASVVPFTRSIGESGQFTDEVLHLCNKLIWDPEDIVQKGVGWALKDNLRSSPDRILPYIKELRRKGVPSTITLYAIRDLKGAERKEVLSIKKDA
ncbi:MAG: DNA alkylation repair protein [Candidatus Hermodarchaeota archaeon]